MVQASAYRLLSHIVSLEALLNVESIDTETLVQLQQVLHSAYTLLRQLTRA